MAKLPDPTNQLDAEGQAIYDKLIGPRDGLSGMYRTLMNHPVLADHVGQLGSFIRYGSTLAGDIRELGILATARGLGAPFIWEKHIAPAKRAQLPDDVIEQVLNGDLVTASMKPIYLWTWQAAQHVVHQENLPQKLQDLLIEELGVKGLLELITACAMYRMISTIVFSFDVALPEKDLIAPF